MIGFGKWIHFAYFDWSFIKIKKIGGIKLVSWEWFYGLGAVQLLSEGSEMLESDVNKLKQFRLFLKYEQMSKIQLVDVNSSRQIDDIIHIFQRTARHIINFDV